MTIGKKKIYRFSRIISKIRVIIHSRFQSSQEDWTEQRRNICASCPRNTKNTGKTTLLLTASKILSQLLSFIAANKSEDMGQCSICTCEIYWKTQEETEECPLKPPKWKSVYIPNSGQINNKNFKI